MSKLTLNDVVSLSLTSHFPLELVPGHTDRRGKKNFRFHCLLNHPSIPELSIVFGDEAHGYLFDSAWFSASEGQKIRVSEATVREILNGSFDAPHWTREMPAAENPFVLNLTVTNPDLGYVWGRGRVLAVDPQFGVIVATRGSDRQAVFLLETEEKPEIGSFVPFHGIYSYPDTVRTATIRRLRA